MASTTIGTGATPAQPGLFARVVGIIFSPRPTFEAIVADPRWLGALVLILVVMGALSFGLMSTEVGREAVLAKQLDSMEAWGVQVTPEIETRLEQRIQQGRYFAIFNGLVWAVVLAAIAGILFAVLSALLGGRATYKQVFAVTVYASVISMLQQLFSVPLAYLRGSMDSSTNLSVFLPMLDDTGFLARFLGMIDLFWLWWTVVLAIGIAVLYRRKTMPILMSFLGVYAVIAIGIAAFLASRATA